MRATIGFCLSEFGVHGGSGGQISMTEGLKPQCEMGADLGHVAPNPCPRAQWNASRGYHGFATGMRAALGFCLSEIGANGGSGGPIFDYQGAEITL